MSLKRPNIFRLLQPVISTLLVYSAAFANGVPQSTTAKASSTSTPDYSKEGFVIESLSKKLDFSTDGTWQSVEAAVIRVQSDAAVRQFGLLSFGYDRHNQKLELAYLRVRKPDGSVIDTPDGSIQDVSSEISRLAPTYSDLREKQIPVKALGVGDVLEYQVRRFQSAADIPDQFWHAQNFTVEAVVLAETLEIVVPSGKYVKVASPALQPEVRRDLEHKTYLWTTRQLKPTLQDSAKPGKPASESVPSVQISTFRSWEEVGRWYGDLEKSRAIVTPAIQAKADELTKGLSNSDDKARAIYDFVSTRFRYISLSFGVGRYQPHTAQEVFENQYGDCKDKHTLFAALLKAAGSDAWPVLIGAGVKLDPEVPSPGQFNHVITFIPNRGAYSWFDTTPEVAPYGLLQPILRDEKALLIPNNASASLVITPADPPFPASQLLDVQATLNDEGTLTGHFDLETRGDVELVLRTAFHQTPPTRWLDLVQQLVRAEGFAGTVSNLNIDDPDALTKPFHYSFDYKRSDYSDWQDRRISPPLFSLLMLPVDDKPVEPFFLGAPGEVRFQATLNLPPNYSAEIPSPLKTQADFAAFESSYSLKGSVLTASRRLVIKQAKIQPAAWDSYRNFAKQIVGDHDRTIDLTTLSASGKPSAAVDNPEAANLISQAFQAGQRQDNNAVRDYLVRAERLNPKQRNL